MAALDHIREELISRWSGHGYVQICLAILELLEKQPIDQTAMLTYGTFAKQLQRKVDQELLAAISVLASTSLDVLDAHALFIDGDYEREISPTELFEVTAGAPLIHPESGEIVEDPLAHLMPFFVPSLRVKDALGG